MLGLVVAAAVVSYYRMATAPSGAKGAAPGTAPNAAAFLESGGPAVSEGASVGVEQFPPGAGAGAGTDDERRSLVLEIALASLPGWHGKITARDDNWATATVRAVSPDGKVTLDIRVSWDSELGDYEVLSATPVVAPQRPSAHSSAIPKGIVKAIVSRPSFANLPDREIIPKQITEKTAVIVVRGGGAQWRVALQRRGDKWVITDARKLQPVP